MAFWRVRQEQGVIHEEMAVLTVVCVKAKPAYGHRDVNRLKAMVDRNMTIPHRFICFTDDTGGVTCNTKKLPAGVGGWWAKLAMFRPGILSGKILYIDLDTLITDSLDFVDEYQGKFAILSDFYDPPHYGSGVMLWNECPTQVCTNWEHGRPIHPMGDQGWVEQQVKDADFFQDLWPGKFVSYKVHCADGVPQDAAMVCFHGDPKPWHFDENHWVQKIWTGQDRKAA